MRGAASGPSARNIPRNNSDALEPVQLQRAEERLTLHELIRLGLARQEDLKFLQTVRPVVALAACMPPCRQRKHTYACTWGWRNGLYASLQTHIHHVYTFRAHTQTHIQLPHKRYTWITLRAALSKTDCM